MCDYKLDPYEILIKYKSCDIIAWVSNSVIKLN